MKPAEDLQVRSGQFQDSGLVISHALYLCTAVSENKVLCHPASIDTICTSAGTEDHVSMGGWAARKCLQVIDNVQRGF